MTRRAVLFLAILVALRAAARAQDLKVIVTPHVLRASSDSEHWAFDFHYPTLQVPGALAGVRGMVRDFNRQMARDAEASLRAFKGEAVRWGARPLPAGGESTRDVHYDLLARTVSVISVKFTQEQMMRRAAHPVTTIATRTFFVGRFVQLSDLFKPGSPWLALLSEVVRNAVMRQAQAQKFVIISAEGFGPRLGNFRAFCVSKPGLVIYLQQYQVAAGYVGPLTVVVPWAALRKVLTEEVHDTVVTGNGV